MFGTVLLGALTAAVGVHAEDTPLLSVCEVLNHRLLYNGKNVIIFGRYVSGMEAWSLNDDCLGHLVIDGHPWAYAITLGWEADTTAPPPALPTGFRWKREMLIPRLPQGTDPKLLQDDRGCFRSKGWAAIFGRFETRAAFEVRRIASETQVIGFGHLGGWAAQMISPEGGRFCLTSEKDECGPAGAGMDCSVHLWMRLRTALNGSDGAAYFSTGMKDALIPGPGLGVRVLKGAVLSSTPTIHPQVLILSMSDYPRPGAPEVTLRLSAPLKDPIAPGTLVEFEGVGAEFTRSPFMVTFEVPLSSLRFATEKK